MDRAYAPVVGVRYCWCYGTLLVQSRRGQAASALWVDMCSLLATVHATSPHEFGALAVYINRLLPLLCCVLQAHRRLQYRLEVYKTLECGWGVQSWDMIYAGTLVCIMVGRIIR